MLKKDVKVGGHYIAKVNNNLTVVRLDKIDKKPTYKGVFTLKAGTNYHCTSLRTGHKTMFRSATAFRREATPQELKEKRHIRYNTGDTTLKTETKKVGLDGKKSKIARTGSPGDSLEIGDQEPEGEQCSDPTTASAGVVNEYPKDSRVQRESCATTAPTDSELTQSESEEGEKGPDPTSNTGKVTQVMSGTFSPVSAGAKTAVPTAPPKAKKVISDELFENDGYEWSRAAVEAGYSSDNPPPEGWQPGQVQTFEQRFPELATKAKVAKEMVEAEAKEKVSPAPRTGLAASLRSSNSNEPPHMEVSALAGTGKTTTAVQGLIRAKGGTPNITPSEQQEEVWKQMSLGRLDSVRVSAFNTAITDEMKRKLNEAGLDKKGVEAKGIHAMGFGAVIKAFGKQEPKNFAVKERIGQVLGMDTRQMAKDPAWASVLEATDKLVGLCKQNMADPTPENLDELARHYEVEIEGEDETERVYDLVPQVLEKCLRPEGLIAFDDMVWLPVKLGLPIYRTDMQIVDEAQDLNRMQQELVYRAGRRIIFIGDRNQAIYGFAGADAESMDRMKNYLATEGRMFGGQPKGCVTLPLTVTRRCGKAIVREACKLVPGFQAHESNCEGLIREARYPLQKGSSNYWMGGSKPKELPWEQTYCPLAEAGDMVLCRVNAPLVGQCFRFIKRKIPANILGRNIGDGLVGLVDKSKMHTTERLIGWMDDWLTKEMAQESAKRHPSEHRMIALQDRHDCILCFAEDTTTVDEVKAKISEVFVDKRCPKCKRNYAELSAKNCSNPACNGAVLELPNGIRLSSIHKSKGLEAKRVFLLEPEGATVPHPMAKSAWQYQQELNLRYVAITRAREELIYVS